MFGEVGLCLDNEVRAVNSSAAEQITTNANEQVEAKMDILDIVMARWGEQ